MNLEFSLLNLLLAASWLLTLNTLGIVPVFISIGVIFSASLPVCVLLILLQSMVSFFIVTQNGSKKLFFHTQLNYLIRIFFIFISVFGAAYSGHAVSSLLIFIGLIGSLPVVPWSLFFDRHAQGQTRGALLYAAWLPALAAVSVLLKIKASMISEWPQTWTIVLSSVGLITFLLSSYFALIKHKRKAVWLHLSQAWLGLLLFVLQAETENYVKLVFAAVSMFLVSMPIIMELGFQMGLSYRILTKVVILGLPGFLSFSSLYYALKCVISINVNWIWLMMIALSIQSLSVTLIDVKTSSNSILAVSRAVKFRFFLALGVQVFGAFGLYWLERMGKL